MNLTLRQKEVYTLLKMGYNQKIIAAMLGVEVKTLYQHANNIYHKLDISGWDQDKQIILMRRKNDENFIIPSASAFS